MSERFYAKTDVEFSCRNSGTRGIEWVMLSQKNDPCPWLDRNIVVAVGGACLDNGKPGARGATGVYFGVNNVHNESNLLPPGVDHTNNRAEMFAAIRALQIVYNGVYTDVKPKRVVIKSDSLILVEGVTNWIHTWCENGWRKSSLRHPVKNQDLWGALEEWILKVKSLKGNGIDVDFWWVSKKENKQAGALARESFDLAGYVKRTSDAPREILAMGGGLMVFSSDAKYK